MGHHLDFVEDVGEADETAVGVDALVAGGGVIVVS